MSSSYSRAQQTIIEDNAQIKQVIAAAGSGKTRTVIGLVQHAVQRQSVHDGEILILSFTRKACGELKERLASVGMTVEVNTFHAFALQAIKGHHPIYSKASVSVISDEEKLLFFSTKLRQHADEIGGIPFEVLLKRKAEFRRLFPELSMKVFREFYAYKRLHNKLEYDDLVSILLHELESQKEWTNVVRNRFPMIIVDEFQDTDPGQLRFLQLMQPQRLITVGDDYQAIYSFRDATVGPFLNFKRLFPKAKLFRLDENYRSVADIIELSNRWIRQSSKQINKRVVAMRRSPGRSRVLLSLNVTTQNSSDMRLIFESLPDAVLLTRTNRRRIFLQREWGIPHDRVMTIHRSKGLEFKIVFLDMAAGWGGSDREDQSIRDEEIRVAYVGMTRAMDTLVILHKDAYRDEEPEGEYWSFLRSHCNRVRGIEILKILNPRKKQTLNRRMFGENSYIDMRSWLMKK